VSILKNKYNKGLTLIEILVSFVVGSVMMIAIYFSYSVFAGSYLAIIEKTNVKLSLAEKYKKAIKGAKFQPKDEGKREGASGLKTIRIVPTN